MVPDMVSDLVVLGVVLLSLDRPRGRPLVEMVFVLGRPRPRPRVFNDEFVLI